MKLLIFAHVPPPFHGQSYGVQLMLNGFGGDCRKQKQPTPNGYGIECYHVNARLSKKLEDIGEFQGAKILLVLFYCLQAIYCRFRYGVTNFYYVPAPGKPVALYRDWLILFICRLFYKRTILHCHAEFQKFPVAPPMHSLGSGPGRRCSRADALGSKPANNYWPANQPTAALKS